MKRRLHLSAVNVLGSPAAFLLSFALLFTPGAQAAQVEETVTRRVAQHFLASRSMMFADTRGEDLELVRSVGSMASGNSSTQVFYRIYNVGSQGFVVVAGDDAVTPVLAYSTEHAFADAELPVNVAKWFDNYTEQIRGTVEAHTVAAPEIAEAWTRLISGDTPLAGGDRSVDPLCQTTWDQPSPYNAQCPGGSVTGCVATAMAQVMKYHNHPANGAGFHSYSAPNYGTLSANFGATTYEWGSMPNSISGANNAIATLMYHCGVSVDMQYSPQFSGAWVLEAHSPTTDHNAQYALKTYFGYSTDIQGIFRNNYTLANWNSTLKSELDASRPIIYAGFGQGGGHCFVLDGYDNNDFFHFNWGWSGAYNGFFAMDALNPDGQGTGGGTGAYNDNQEALINIHPATGGGGGGGETADMLLYNYVTPSNTTIYYGQAFSVSTNILNNGTTDFNGDFCAAVFDASNNFYGFIQTYAGESLPAGFVYNNDVVFSSTGLFSMVPGTYYLGIFYRTNGGEWTQVGDNGGYTNFPQVTVINPNDIEVYGAMTPSPGSTVAQGAQLSVNLNILNNGFDTFYGQYGVALYNLDGSWAQDIGTLNEDGGLPSGYTYLDPFLTFGPAQVTVPPGTYLMACQHNPNNTGWQLTGSSFFQNPIFINVVEPGLSPDQYEVNNTVAQAYSLPVNFSGNTTSTSTTGSNLHTGSDADFYKVVLAGGYDYAITARLHDSYNSGNGNTYTMDGIFSWSSDGTNWSDVFDDVMPNDIIVNGGGTVYFQVAPYFAGETGTYLLQLDMLRGQNVGVGDPSVMPAITTYPNPANDRLVIDASTTSARIERVELLDAQGRSVRMLLTGGTINGRFVSDISSIPTGAYTVRISTDNGTFCERIIIAR